MFPTCFLESQILDIGSGPQTSLVSLFACILRHPEPWADLLYPCYKTNPLHSLMPDISNNERAKTLEVSAIQ